MPELRLLALPLLLAPVPAAAQAPSTSSHPPEWTEPIAPFRIADRLYYVGSRDLAAYLIDGGSGLILLDAGLPEFAPKLLENVRSLGFDPKRIRLLLSSQAHFDHAGGLAAIQAATGATMAASQEDAALLARGGKGDFTWGDELPYPALKVGRIVRDGENVTVGGATLTAHLTPGHTKGCTTWTMPVKIGGRTETAAFLCGTSAPGYKLVGNAGYPTIVEDYRRTFAKLRSLPCRVFLGAHGSYFGLDAKRAKLASRPAQNPFVDPEGCQRHVDRAEKAFENQLAREQAARR
jgi:metallo-beta-lactamase class B